MSHWTDDYILLPKDFTGEYKCFDGEGGYITSFTGREAAVAFIENNFREVITEKDSTNPKEARGALKAPSGFTPNTFLIELDTVMAGGAHKYGPYNFRDSLIDAMTYVGAIKRHFYLWEDGEDYDEESGQSHLAHIAACCALIRDSQHTGMFEDNRAKTGLVKGLLEKAAKSFNKFKSGNKSIEEVLNGKEKEKGREI